MLNVAALSNLPPAAKVLVLSARQAERRVPVAPQADVVRDIAALDGAEEAFDAAVIDGILEEEPWDRWMLQRVHRVLRTDAPVVLVVPALLSASSVVDLGFLGYASRQILIRITERLGARVEFSGPVRRRYPFSRLARKLESAGYTAAACGRTGFAGRCVVTARKARSPYWPPSAATEHPLGAKQEAALRAREEWLRRFPQPREVPRPIDPQQWARARVLVLSPHPDDELIGCGGTLCRLVRAGAKVTILQATDGGKLESLSELPPDERKTVRLGEASRVAAALGADAVFWSEPDAGLRCTPRTVRKLSRVLEELRPTHVFTPFLADLHADHRELSAILAGALRATGLNTEVLQYEVWGVLPVNRYCDVTDEARTLHRLLFLYERAMRVENFAEFCEARNLRGARELCGGSGYAEAFFSTPGAQYQRFVDPAVGS